MLPPAPTATPRAPEPPRSPKGEAWGLPLVLQRHSRRARRPPPGDELSPRRVPQPGAAPPRRKPRVPLGRPGNGAGSRGARVRGPSGPGRSPRGRACGTACPTAPRTPKGTAGPHLQAKNAATVDLPT